MEQREPADVRICLSGKPLMRSPNLRVLGIMIACVTAVGCQQRQLMPTPNLYAYSDDDAFDRVPEIYRNNQVDVLYVTDRKPDGVDENGPDYGYGRSHSMAFGSCIVEIGKDVSWEALVRASQLERRDVSLPLSVKTVHELARFPNVPYPLVQETPRPVVDPEILAKCEETEAALHKELAERLSHSDRKHVYIYIHGFANTFEDAVMTTAELWHFLGRQGMPVCYTWPAGRGMSGQGYVYDSVSCEFTIFHLKQFLRALGRCPQIEKVHILAHSRGTDVATAAVRELHIEHKHADVSAREAIKLGNLVLAAPDLDFDVVQQRLGGERVGYVPERGTIYTSPTDRALALADVLTLGVARLGQLQPSKLPPRLRELLEMSPVTFVEALVDAGFLGHSYFHDSPAVSSDLILILRDNRPPGKEHGRPLKERLTNFNELRDDYLKEK
jgi:esterase/lipase superfamily enzyme